MILSFTLYSANCRVDTEYPEYSVMHFVTNIETLHVKFNSTSTKLNFYEGFFLI